MTALVLKKPAILKRPAWKRRAVPARKKPAAPPRAQDITEDEQLPEIIQGKTVGSKNEARVALALDFLGFHYRYQVSESGGRELRGGQVLDFLVTSTHPQTVVDVRGAYWHSGKREDELQLQRVLQAKKYKLVVVWDYESTSVEQAIAILRQRLPS